MLGKLDRGLYSLNEEFLDSSNKHALVSHSLTSIKEAKLWHLRFGHMSFEKIKSIKGTDVQGCLAENLCQVCPLAKQSRFSFPSSCIKSSKPFELIHIDVWGPYVLSTQNGCNQFLTIVDDYTRMTWVHFMKNKTDSVSIMSQFLSFVETQFSSKVLIVRSDNAPDLTKGSMKKLFLQHGILQQKSCSDTPQQNGVVERKHRHLLETGRALFIQSRVPAHFWGDCILSAAFLINRMPLKSIEFQSPYERLYNVPHHT